MRLADKVGIATGVFLGYKYAIPAMRERAEKESRKFGLALAKQSEPNIPPGRLALPDDVAPVAAFLASEEAAYMTGQAIDATGGPWMH